MEKNTISPPEGISKKKKKKQSGAHETAIAEEADNNKVTKVISKKKKKRRSSTHGIATAEEADTNKVTKVEVTEEDPNQGAIVEVSDTQNAIEVVGTNDHEETKAGDFRICIAEVADAHEVTTVKGSENYQVTRATETNNHKDIIGGPDAHERAFVEEANVHDVTKIDGPNDHEETKVGGSDIRVTATADGTNDKKLQKLMHACLKHLVRMQYLVEEHEKLRKKLNSSIKKFDHNQHAYLKKIQHESKCMDLVKKQIYWLKTSIKKGSKPPSKLERKQLAEDIIMKNDQYLSIRDNIIQDFIVQYIRYARLNRLYEEESENKKRLQLEYQKLNRIIVALSKKSYSEIKQYHHILKEIQLQLTRMIEKID